MEYKSSIDSRTSILTCFFGLFLFFALVYSSRLISEKPDGLITFWPACGILLSLLFSQNKIYNFLLLSLAFLGVVLFEIIFGYYFGILTLLSLGSIISAIIIFFVMSRVFRGRVNLDSVNKYSYFLFLSVAVTGVIGILTIGIFEILFGYSGKSFWGHFFSLWLSENLSIQIFVPMVFAFKDSRFEWKSIRFWKVLELILLLIIWGYLTRNALTIPGRESDFSVRPYMIAAILPWIAFRFGMGTSALASLLMALMIFTTKEVLEGPYLWGDKSIEMRFAEANIYCIITMVSQYILTISIAHSEKKDSDYKKLFEQSSDGIFLTNSGGNYLNANEVFSMLTGYSKKELLEMDITQIFPRSELAGIGLDMENLYKSQSAEVDWNIQRKDGSSFLGELRTRMLMDGKIQGVVRDVSEKRKMEKILAENELKMRTIFELLPIGITLLDSESHVVDMNSFIEKILHISRAGLLRGDYRFRKYLHPDGSLMDLTEYPSYKVLKNKETIQGQVIGVILEDGTKIWTRVSAAPLELGGVGCVLVTHDITEEKNREELLNLFKVAVEQSASAIVLTNMHGFIEYVNPKFCKDTGYTREEVYGKNPRFLKSGETSGNDYRELWRKILDGKEWRGLFHNKRKNGELYWDSTSISPVFDTQGKLTHYLAIKEEVTEKKEMEDRLIGHEKYLSLLISTLPGMVYNCINDSNWTMTFVSDGCVSLTGYSTKELEMNKVISYGEIIHIDDRDWLWKKCQVSLENQKACNNEYRIIHKSGEVRWVWERAEGEYREDGTLEKIHGFITDITERKNMEVGLENSLNEKSVLLSEIHHRVKNNLQVVSSIIRLGIFKQKDPEVKRFLEETSLRVNAMGLLHNKLYESNDFSLIDMKDYIRMIAEMIGEIQDKSKFDVHFVYEIENIFMNLETAMPCGLILNEIITNSYKYAFRDRNNCEIHISLKKNEKGFSLNITDNGEGMKDLTKLENSPSIGYKMIRMLVKQLHGEMKVDGSQGTRYFIQFQESNKELKRWKKES